MAETHLILVRSGTGEQQWLLTTSLYRFKTRRMVSELGIFAFG